MKELYQTKRSVAFISIYFLLVITFISIFLLLVNAMGYAQTKDLSGYKINSTGFFENKGQITDQNHKPNPDVKYLLNSSGFDVQLRQTGFSYDTYTDSVASSQLSGVSQELLAAKGKYEQPEKFVRHYHRVDIELQGCNINAQIIAEKKSSAYFNYLTGTIQGGISDVHYYQKVTYKNIYPNIDLEFFATTKKQPKTNSAQVSSIPLEYQFIVHPDGNPDDIKLKYKGAIKTVLEDNKLLVRVDAGDFTENIPSSYLKGNGQAVNVSYATLGNNVFTFSLPQNIALTSDLVIDPVPNLLWGTYYGDGGGANGDYSYAIAVDASGNSYIAGRTQSTSLIATAGTYESSFSGSQNAFAAKFNSTGTTLLWGTYYGSGGGSGDQAFAIAIDASDNVYITGNTESTTGIATGGVYQPAISGTSINAFVTKINPTGTALVWGTYYGGTSQTTGWGITVDASNNVYVTGTTTSTSGIATAGSYLSNYPVHSIAAFVSEFNSTGTALLWGTYYGGTGSTNSFAIALDAANNVYITGLTSSTSGISTLGAYQSAVTASAGNSNAFAAEFNSPGNLVWGTYFGGNVNDWAYALALDASTNVYIAGLTQSTLGIATVGAYKTSLTCAANRFNAFVAKINSGGGSIGWGTYYGGNVYDQAWSIAVDGSDNSYITGLTQSTTGIATAGAYQTSFIGGLGGYNIFVAKLDPAGLNLLWGTYYGGTLWNQGYGIALGPCDNVYITGSTESTSDIATVGASQTTYVSAGSHYDGFVAEFDSTGNNSALVVTAPNTPTLCNGGTGTATAVVSGGNSPYTYLWNPGGQTNVTATGLSIGTYTIRVNNNCGNTGSATTIISQPASTLSATTSSTGVSCSGGNIGTATAMPTGGGTPYTYLWNPGGQANVTATGLGAGTYTVTVMDICGNTTSATTTILITTTTPPAITATANTSSICEGAPVTLSVFIANVLSPPIWNPGALTGATVLATPTVTTTYTVTGSNACGTADTIVTVNVNPLPTPAFNAGILSGCPPLCIQFYNLSTISSGKVAASNWSFGDGDTLNSLNPAYCYKIPGIYSVKITTTSDSGCSATLTQQNYITVYTNPVANFTTTPQPTTILQPTIQFTDKSTDAYGIAEWNWGFGDASDSSSQSQNTSHTYQDTGMYCAKLVVMNTHGCTDSITNCLMINPIFTLYIPSAFTPNGDGLNDVFQVKGNDVKGFEMYVFDRWGTELFNGKDINTGWNGTFKNRICQEDAYVYEITVYDSENSKHSYTGTVNLLK